MSNTLTFNLLDWFINIFYQIKMVVNQICFTTL